ncbi:MAG: putative porin [Candidatus Abyssubacteria bacterium]
MKRLVVGICAGLVMLLPRASYGEGQSEIEVLRKMVEEQNRTINQLLERIETLETQQERIEVTQEEQGEWIESDKAAEPLWAEKVRVKGDFRYRYEHIRDDSRGNDRDDNRNRNRIRARLGVEAMLSDEIDLGFQLATGEVVDANGKDEGDPVSNNQSLTDAWSLKNIWLSQAYFDYHPAYLPGFSLVGGKMERPFITPVSSELIWDSDVNPEGGVITYHRSLDQLDLYANGYGFWVVERSKEGDTGMFGGQAAAKYNFTALDDKAHLMGGVSYYDFGNIKGKEFFVDGDSFGNTEDPLIPGTFAEDFDLFNAFGEFGFKVRGLPVAAFGDYVVNTDADDEDTGWSLGVKVGKAKEPHTWEVRYLYKDVERDAVLGTFTDSDFGGGGTNTEGHELNFVYALAKNWSVAATYFHNDINVDHEPGEKEDDFQRVQLDMIFKF